MSTYRKEGKDVIIFATAEDHKEPSKITLPAPEPPAGLILPNGEINWNCPCLGGMATGPCGVEFREAFSCFHNSEAEPKGSDCYEAFKEMHLCMAEYPQLYNKYNDDDDKDLEIPDLEGVENVLNDDSKPSEPSEKVSGTPPREDKSTDKKPAVEKEPKKSGADTPKGTLKIPS